MAGRQFVIFNVNSKQYGVEIIRVSSIERLEEIHAVPNTPAFIEGIMNLRGKVYSVFNLRKRFGIQSIENSETTKVVMTHAGTSIIGFIVDSVNEITSIEEKDIDTSPEPLGKLKNKFISGVAVKGDKTILLLDIDKVLSISGEGDKTTAG